MNIKMETNANPKVSCIANYPYEASEPDELSLKVEDIIRDVEKLPGGWWRGELRGKRGMFPDNFVSIIDQASQRTSGVQGRCRAVFSYQPANPDELALCVGDVLEVLGEVEEGWWQGKRQGRVGVFPSNFVVLLDPPAPAPPTEPAPALPPKPVKEQCRVLFPYTAVNEDELSLNEGDIVTLISKDAPDRGWWRGEVRGKIGLFPDNFVQLLPAVTQDPVEEKKPERPSKSTTPSLYPILNKYSEKTSSIKELTTSKISLHKENTSTKENSTHSSVTHTNKSESEKTVQNETINDGSLELKKPPVPSKKSPTPGGLLSGLKSKMLAGSDKDAPPPLGDRPDGAAQWRAPAATFDRVERNSILNDPRAGRVKAPRRRPPSQILRDDAHTNGGEPDQNPQEKPEKVDEIKPKAREWEKHRAPWMAELKLNQAKKTGEVKSRTSSTSDNGMTSKTGAGSTDRLLECGLEEKRSTHSMEMSKSTSSISSKMSVLESFEETAKVRHSLDSKKEASTKETNDVSNKTTNVHSPTAAGRTFTTMLEEVKKPPAPAPPSASARTYIEQNDGNSVKIDKITTSMTEKYSEYKVGNHTDRMSEKSEKTERSERNGEEKPIDKPTVATDRSTERRSHNAQSDVEILITHLNNRIQNLEKLLEVQNAKFTSAIEDMNVKLALEVDKRLALQSELEKLAHCVTQV